MDINQLAKNYFNGFSEISHFKENAKKTNAFAVLKLISYLTLLIPCLIGAIYLASLRGRVQKKKLLDHVDIKVDTQKKKIESKSKEGLKDQATKAPYTMMEKDIQPHIIEQIMAQIQERIKFAKERWILIERFYPFVDVVRRLAQDPKIFYLDTADVESSVKTQPDVVKVYAEDFCKKYHQCIEVMSALDKEVKECGTINEAVEELNKVQGLGGQVKRINNVMAGIHLIFQSVYRNLKKIHPDAVKEINNYLVLYLAEQKKIADLMRQP